MINTNEISTSLLLFLKSISFKNLTFFFFEKRLNFLQSNFLNKFYSQYKDK